VTFTLGVAVWASFIQYWPYNLSFTLSNYNFDRFEPQGWSPYFTSVKMAFFASVIGTTIIFTGAYLIEKTNAFPIGRAIAHFLAMMPVAVPGLVLGLGYVFFFNAIWNPLNFLYATLAILVINTIAHFFTVSHITAMTALKQIDREFEAVSASLKIPFWKTFRRVTVPICMPAILDIAVYLFVNAMTTVSAVIFLYGAHTKLASVSIVHMDEAGFIAAAAAMATMIVATAIGVKVLHILLDRQMTRAIAQSEGDTNLSDLRAQWSARAHDDATRTALAEDARHFLHQSVSTPCLNAIAKAEGIWIEDVAGRRYMDFHGNNVHHIGYGHPRLKKAIADQMDALPFAPRRYANEPATALARKLGEIAPGDLSKVLFTTGGSDAVEVAVKIARAATGRFKVVSFWDAFHGAGLGAGSLSGEALFRSGPAAPIDAGDKPGRALCLLSLPVRPRCRR
jgi:ABC-type spermidine/putrescine transport system permease subunit II